MSVPKTTVDKYRDTFAMKHKVRFAEYVRVAPPSSNAVTAK
jgi:hypothetical protein